MNISPTRKNDARTKPAKAGIFVDDADTFDIVAHYRCKEGRIQTLDKAEEGAESLTVTFRKPDYGVTQQLLRASTGVREGQPYVDFGQLQHSLFYSLARSWNATDAEGKPVELTPAAISKLHPSLAQAVVSALDKKLGEDGAL